MHRYKLLISYDGSNFGGWQIQPNSVTIQEELQKVLKKICQQEVKVIGSGRTDTGVHALGQIAHVDLFCKHSPNNIQKSLNALLPPAIRILEITLVSTDFHARFSSKRKTYCYHITTTKTQDPIKRFYSLHYPYPLDIDLMKKASTQFVGTHDFRTFANQSDYGSAKNSPIKTLYEIDIKKTPDGFICTFTGSGFLYKMVRNLVGTLLSVGRGKLPIEKIPHLIAQKKRTCLKEPAAPAHGLFLVSVEYNHRDNYNLEDSEPMWRNGRRDGFKIRS